IPRPDTSPPSRLPLTTTGSIASPRLHKFNRDDYFGCVQSSPQISMRSPKAVLTTPRRRTAANRQRIRHLSGCSSMRTVPASPQIFDEEAMFLGREEFLNETNTTCSVGIISPPRTLSNRSSDDGFEAEAVLASLSKRRKQISPLPPSISPPVLRLTSVSKSTVQHSSQSGLHDSDVLIPTACRLQPKPSVLRKRSQMTKLTADPIDTSSKQSNRNTVDSFPFLTKPERSPFAPLHVFVNRPSTLEAGHTFIPGPIMRP
ncbi:hypothetical protein P879_11821, partial [Paragonimus westermani]